MCFVDTFNITIDKQVSNVDLLESCSSFRDLSRSLPLTLSSLLLLIIHSYERRWVIFIALMELLRFIPVQHENACVVVVVE